MRRLADHLADEFIKRTTPNPAIGPPDARDRVLPPPGTHLLVWQRLDDGKQRWILVDQKDPSQSVDEVMRGWENDPTVRAQMVFEGYMRMRGDKDRNPSQPS